MSMRCRESTAVVAGRRSGAPAIVRAMTRALVPAVHGPGERWNRNAVIFGRAVRKDAARRAVEEARREWQETPAARRETEAFRRTTARIEELPRSLATDATGPG